MRIRDWDPNLKVRLFGEALMNITFWMFYPFLTIYFSEEFGKGKVGILLIFSQAFSVLANLMGGYCADRFGRKRMMVLSSIGQGLSFIIFGFASSPWLTSPWLGFGAYALSGVFGSFYWPASQAMVADVVAEKDRSDVFAIFYTSINIAVVVGPILGSIFYVHYRFPLLLIAGFICILLGLLLTKMARETAPNHIELSSENGKWYSFLKNQAKDYSLIVKDRIFLMFIIAGVLVGQTFMQLDLVIPIYIKDVITHSQNLLSIGSWSISAKAEQVFGIICAENGLLVALFTVVITKWMNKYSERFSFVLSSLFYAVAILLFGQTHFILGLIFAMAIFTLGELVAVGQQQSFISKLAPDHMRGQYFAAGSLRFTFSRTIAPLFIPMTVWIGYKWTFLVLSLLAILSAGLYWGMFRLYSRNQLKQDGHTA